MFFFSCLVFLILRESLNSLVMIGVSFKVKFCKNFVGIVFGCVVLYIFKFVVVYIYCCFLYGCFLCFGVGCLFWMVYLKEFLLYKLSGIGYLGILFWIICF